MSARSRSKGVRAEREVEVEFQRAGFATDRNIGGRRQVSGDIAVEGLAVEVRRREKQNIPRWWIDHAAECPTHVVPVVASRASHQPWLVTLSLQDFLDLLAEARS
jgi:hypothetical protein